MRHKECALSRVCVGAKIISLVRSQETRTENLKAKSVAAGAEHLESEVEQAEVGQPEVEQPEGSQSEETVPQLLNGPSLEEIHQRAYDIHIDRGAPHGYDMDDWLQAERELTEKYTAS
jgi:hypothetical protein